MHLTRYTDDHAEAWDQFVATTRNGTLFHTRRFLQYHPADRFVDHSLLVQDDHPNTHAILSAAEVEDDGQRWLVSHPGASYGGFALSAKQGMAYTNEYLDLLEAYAREQDFAGIRMLRLTPPSLRRAAADDQEYWLFQRGWQQTRSELGNTLFLTGISDEILMSEFTGKCRNMIRQAQKSGLTVRASDDYAAFWKILEQTLTARHDSKPTHTLDEFITLQGLLPDHIHLTAAFDDETMVAGIVTVDVTETARYTLYIAQDYEAQKHHPVHLIVYHLAQAGIQAGKPVLHFGISTEAGGTEVNDGLFFFKESFGARPIVRTSWQLEIGG